MTAPLHVYDFDAGEERWVAESAEDVLRQHSEYSGCNCIENGEHQIAQLPDDKPFRICGTAEGNIASLDDWDRKTKVTRTCAEWAAREGRGMLCTVNQ